MVAMVPKKESWARGSQRFLSPCETFVGTMAPWFLAVVSKPMWDGCGFNYTWFLCSQPLWSWLNITFTTQLLIAILWLFCSLFWYSVKFVSIYGIMGLNEQLSPAYNCLRKSRRKPFLPSWPLPIWLQNSFGCVIRLHFAQELDWLWKCKTLLLNIKV